MTKVWIMQNQSKVIIDNAAWVSNLIMLRREFGLYPVGHTEDLEETDNMMQVIVKGTKESRVIQGIMTWLT